MAERKSLMSIVKSLKSILLAFLMLAVLMPHNSAYACDTASDCSEHIHMDSNAALTENFDGTWEKEVVVEVENEAETFNYPLNPNYRYTFVWTTPSLARAICYNCGRATMSTATRKSQWGTDVIQCPLGYGAGLDNDFFYTWHIYRYERCTSCGYKSQEWFDKITYTAVCNNGLPDPSFAIEWQVKADYNPNRGDDPHQNLRWWLYRELY